MIPEATGDGARQAAPPLTKADLGTDRGIEDDDGDDAVKCTCDITRAGEEDLLSNCLLTSGGATRTLAEGASGSERGGAAQGVPCPATIIREPGGNDMDDGNGLEDRSRMAAAGIVPRVSLLVSCGVLAGNTAEDIGQTQDKPATGGATSCLSLATTGDTGPGVCGDIGAGPPQGGGGPSGSMPVPWPCHGGGHAPDHAPGKAPGGGKGPVG